MDITNKTVDLFRDDFQSAVSSIEQKYGIKIELGNIRGDSYGFRGQLTVKNMTGEKQLTPQKEFERKINYSLAARGLRSNMYGMEVDYRGGKITLIDLNPRSPKYPCVVRDQDGKVFRVTLNAFVR